ncbi:MAG: hypothetical protein K6F71_01680 [Ruminococcus sp.]|jgi:hypothetical protein|uniref:Uncharacterized protein n=1 Tax=Ruminococcus albus SY3 TaxID=1341156 RepID=A0A011VZE3_RUMAL|nr:MULTISPECIES: hypothetical protein [Ruminococcus]EXM40696.1 hypothetical protein RASY3_02645 [Ruminococcus albus SY3]MBR3667804.1 hypothetical protein [Ruminococcus sp.]MCR5539536.1 hypothetical protein [Ruminococcus sp.]
MNDSIRQNLIDAGCDEDFIRRFEDCICDRSKCEKLLAQHRRELLDEVHEKEDNISCLDYLVFMMKKEGLK